MRNTDTPCGRMNMLRWIPQFFFGLLLHGRRGGGSHNTWVALLISALVFGFAHIVNPGATVWSSTDLASS